jgi:hypothetical protein
VNERFAFFSGPIKKPRSKEDHGLIEIFKGVFRNPTINRVLPIVLVFNQIKERMVFGFFVVVGCNVSHNTSNTRENVLKRHERKLLSL